MSPAAEGLSAQYAACASEEDEDNGREASARPPDALGSVTHTTVAVI